MDLDEILHDVGEFGKYQKLMLWFVLLPSHLPYGTHYYSQIFMSLTPHHWCQGTSPNTSVNVTYRPLTMWSRNEDKVKNPTISECYVGNWTKLQPDNLTGGVACKNGYEYDRTELYEDESIVTTVEFENDVQLISIALEDASQRDE
ncbi:hypothetical protein JTE90_007534 [Oedothorax gibbosus]|uniref:Uncharacterized protein n=1 Tax=Oedothorax gibbosus TaxID=931172 RepID=A0AAV6VMK7_9ARAC|nr:hypothetical protein JTE90_007534 [Oedothorax gibbosus]